ncbi:helix-turn-helix domain-containing protein [Actinoplanes sp. NPDC051475]|uniref:helix-turn-helix domain-containing protein n=1 Tax=Actinoplanes sp. NPDC051475 TaxID=3157225 RepID=UPI00344C440D
MTNHDLEPLSSRLAALRAQTGLSLKQLGQQLHVSDSSLSRYFTAQALPPWDMVEALATLAGVDPRTLRAEWEATHRARKQSRHSDRTRPAKVLSAPLWEPDWPATSPPPAPSARRFAAVGVGVVLLMTVSAGMAYALSGVTVSADPRSITATPAGPAGAPSSGTPLPTSQPPGGVRLPTARPPDAAPPDSAPSHTHPASRPATSHPVVPVTQPSRAPEPSPTSPSPAQPASGTTIAITNADPGTSSIPYVLDVENWSMDNGARVHLWTWRTDGDYRNQLWVVERLDPTTWRMVNKFSSKCLTRNDVAALEQADCEDTPEQGWQLGAGGALQSRADHRCVEIKGRQRLLDAGLALAACDGGWYQRWQFDRRQSPS